MLIYKDTFLTASRQTDAYCLAAQVDASGLSYAVIDGEGVCRLLQTHPFSPAASYNDWAQTLDTTFREDEWLTKTYAASRWLFPSNKAMLVPESLFDAEKSYACLRYAVPLDELDEIHYRPLPACEAMLVFAAPNPPVNEILKRYPNAQLIHPQESLLSLLAAQDGDNRVALGITRELAGIAVFVGNKLVLSNTCPIRTFTDALYNLLLALNAFHLTQDNFTLYYTGDIGEDGEELLRRYFPRLRELCDSHHHIQLGRPRALIYHLLLTLFTHPSCE
ncbi:MAG: DUF3822 family protein [Prevotellaceae bacterium]|jgi:hypothetical protein|nr:DUF3822 family protein [Prevotellaceae bacterium]